MRILYLDSMCSESEICVCVCVCVCVRACERMCMLVCVFVRLWEMIVKLYQDDYEYDCIEKQ